MIPKAELIYNHDYAQRLHRGTGTFTEAWQDLIFRGEVFERVYHEVITPILETLPQVTGYAWTQQELPIYLVTSGESLAAPTTLPVGSDVEDMLFTLITLLGRVNVATGFTTDQQRDQVAVAVASAVAQKLNLDLEDAAAAATLALHEKYGKHVQPLGWNLQQKTVAAYLKP